MHSIGYITIFSEVVEMLHDEEGDPISDPEVVGDIVYHLKAIYSS